MTPVIERFDRSHLDGWADLVERSPAARFFHRPEWLGILPECFPYRCRSLVAVDGRRLAGVLPLMEMNSPLTGKAMISLPMGVTGAGPLAETSGVARLLIEAAVETALASRARYLELRDVPSPHIHAPNGGRWVRSDEFAIFEEALAASADDALTAIPRKQRNMVRKGVKSGLRAAPDNDLESFYPLYCRTVRGHGTPPLPKRYFQSLLTTFEGDVEILTVRQADAPVIALLAFYHRGVVYPYYVGGADIARRTGGFPFMYHALMARAISRGARRFNFGRSFRNSGAYEFKVNFGFAPKPIPYQFFVRSPDDVPNLHPETPRLKPLLSIWRRLPLPLTVAIGGRISWMAP